MTAVEVLNTLTARGVEVRAEGDQIRFRPRAAAEDLVDEMLAHKPELLKLLARRSAASPWPEALPSLGRRTVGALEACAVCGTATWARYGDLALCVADAQALCDRRHWLAQYREVLYRHWGLNASAGQVEDFPMLDAAQGELAALLGAPVAAAVRRHEARAWFEACRRCPWCGEAEVLHAVGGADPGESDP